MALPNCVKDVLCGLSGGVQNALNALIKIYIAQLDLQIAALEAKLLYLNVLTIPPQALNTLVQTAINEVKSAANLIPLQAIGKCVEVGDLNATIQTNLDAVLLDANTIANDLQRLLSFKDEVEELIADLKVARNLYLEVSGLIEACNAAL